MNVQLVDRGSTGPDGVAASTVRRPARRRGRRLIALAAHREATTQLRRPEFWISLLMTLLILAVSIAVQAAGSPGAGAYTVGVVDGQRALAEAVAPPADGRTVMVTAVPDAGVAVDRVRSGAVDAALLGDGTALYLSDIPAPLRDVLGDAHAHVAVTAALRAEGLDAAQVTGALTVEPLVLRALDAPAAAETQRTVMAAIGVGFVFLLMFGFGQTIAHGVLEEKSSRVVEVLLAKMRASHLLAGKVLGLGVVVLLQIGLLIAGGFLAAWLLDLIADPVDALRVGAIVLAWFVPGYFLFATLWAVAGALASRPEDVVNAAGPVSSIMAAGLLGAVLPYSGATPVLSAALSVVPGFSWAMMPLRMAREAVPWWQVVLAVALLAVAVAVLLRLAGRIYVGGLMNPGGLLNARTALHHAKESGLT